MVGFNLLAAAASIAALSTAQLGVDFRRMKRHPGREAIDEGQEGFSMGFAGSEVSQHSCNSGVRVPACAQREPWSAQFYPECQVADRAI